VLARVNGLIVTLDTPFGAPEHHPAIRVLDLLMAGGVAKTDLAVV